MTAGSGWAICFLSLVRPHSIIFDWLQPGLPRPCMARHSTCRRAGSCEKAPRMPGPPLPITMVVRFEAHSSARALVMRAGTPVMGSAHSGDLGVPSAARPMT